MARGDPRTRRVPRLSTRPALRRGLPGGERSHGDPGPAATMTASSLPSAAETRRVLYLLVLIRAFEERVLTLVSDGSIRGTTHPYVGQEAVAVGACMALRADDWVVSTHRGHGHLLAKGGDPDRLMAELFGKASGYGGGKGGTQHMADFAVGFLGSNG